MATGDRFYQLDFRHRSVLHGDIGSLLKIDGLVVSGGGARAILLLPGFEGVNQIVGSVHILTDEEWSEYIQRSDNPEILVGPAKVFHRKLRYEISGVVQQKVWRADRLACVYCGKEMGDVQLTIDHWIPLELGGENNVSNYLTACRRCNKDKGSQHPKDWLLTKPGGPQLFLTLEHYLKNRVVR